MKTSLIIGMTNTNGDDKQKSITDVSNTATNEELVAFGQGLVAVTNNTYKNTTKVTKVDCDTEQKTARSISGSEYIYETGNTISFPTDGIITFTTDKVATMPSGGLAMRIYSQNYDAACQFLNMKSTDPNADLHFSVIQYCFQSHTATYQRRKWVTSLQGINAVAQVITFTLHFDETDELAEFNLPVTITISDPESQEG